MTWFWIYWYFEGRAKRISWQIGCQLWDSLSPVSRDSKVQPWVISGWPRLSPGSASFYQRSCWETKDLWFSYLLFWDQESDQLNQSKRYCTVSLTWRRTMVKHSLPSKVSFRFAFFSKVHWFPLLERWSHQPTFRKKKVNPISWRLSYGACYLRNTDVLIKWKDRQSKLANAERISPWMLWQQFILVTRQHCITSSELFQFLTACVSKDLERLIWKNSVCKPKSLKIKICNLESVNWQYATFCPQIPHLPFQENQ